MRSLQVVQDPRPISDADKDALRPRLVPAMIALSAPKDKAVRAQIAESVSLIAEIDFPDQWPELIDVSPYSFLCGDVPASWCHCTWSLVLRLRPWFQYQHLHPSHAACDML